MNYIQDCSVQMEMLEDGWEKLKGNKEIKTEMMIEQIRFSWSHFKFYHIF